MTVKQLTILLAALMTSSGMAIADDAPSPPKYPFSWAPETLGEVKQGDVNRGKAVAKANKCKKCHGKTGISDEDDTPSLAGQTAAYTYKQLIDYKYGARDDKSMKKATKKLSTQDIADLGAFFATQEAEKKLGTKAPLLVTKGDKKRLLLGCDDCHNESVKTRKLIDIPATLEGQKPQYLIDTLMAFKEGDRENDLHSRMRFIAERLTEKEIEELAGYYGTKPIDDD